MNKSKIKIGVGILLAVFMLLSCDAGIVGNGDVQTRTESIGDFDRLEIDGNFNVILDQTGKPGLRIEADENILDVIKVYESGNKLEIRSEENIIRARKKNLYINFDELTKIEFSGAIKIRSEEELIFKSIRIAGGGAADVRLDIQAESLRIDISGAADFDLKGQVEEADLLISGAGSFDLLDLRTEKTTIVISGAAHARVFATDELNVEISGAGAVRYKGNPDVSKVVSGIGTLKKY